MITCINLMARFGDLYRISFDPAYDPKGRPRAKLDPWFMTIRCHYGEIATPWIAPQGGNQLRLDIDNHNRTANRVAALPDCRFLLDGDFEKTILFPVDRFDDVAAIVKPYRRPQVSAERRAQLRSGMAAVRAQKLESPPDPAAPAISQASP